MEKQNMKEKEKIKLKCPRSSCGYEWYCKSKMNWISCPKCMYKFKFRGE